MRTLIALATVALAAVAFAVPASAAGGPVAGETANSMSGTDCLRAGQDTLRTISPDGNSLSYFARNGVPLSVIGGTGTAPLATVFTLHLKTPSLFPWCAKS